MATNKAETEVIEAYRLDESAALLNLARYVLRVSQSEDQALILHDDELHGLEILLAEVQVNLGRGYV
ncbi:hypothetical protein FACS1894110_16710 [Spirochaetia bacterium]|nr:hypothetical protein FACS1894110_16710 [Spirochaetia bacterium]